MICPECMAEYREGFTRCADCDEELVASLDDTPASSSGEARANRDALGFGAGEDDPYCKFWEGEDARVFAEICGVLDEAGIPYRALRRDAQLFRISPNSQMKIGVPFSLYEQAELAVVEAFGGAPETRKLLWPSSENRPEDGPGR